MARGRKSLEDTAETRVVDSGSEDRLARFGDAVSRLRGGRRIDIDRAQLIGGGALAVLGLMAILFGWWGAAHTGLPFEQTPYLISGGMLGLALCFLGGFLYFAYWITRLVRESRAQTERAAELLDQIAETLSSNGYGRASRPRAIAGAGEEFVATRSGTFFHRPDCATVTERQKLRKVTAKTPGLEPCRICNPLATEAD